jgi:hypothetical protein
MATVSITVAAAAKPPPPCSGLKGQKLADCKAALQRDAALNACSRVKGKKRHNACVRAAQLAYRRALAVAHCQTLKAKKKTTCIGGANKLK